MMQDFPQTALPTILPPPEFTAAFVDVDGARVHYVHAGSGPPMVLIHGLIGSSINWRGNIAALSQRARVYAIDLVNMGKSQRVAGIDPGLKATAQRIVAIMDALGIASADIVGHSHGGAVALMLASRYPQRVRRLLLFAPVNPYNRSTDVMVRFYGSRWGGVALRMLPYLPAYIQRIALGDLHGGADQVVDTCLQEYVEALRNTHTLRHVHWIIRSWFAEMAKLRRALSRVVRVPTLLVWGDSDCTCSLASGVRLHRKLRASELVVVPGGGHSVFEQTPAEANRILLDWLDRVPLPTPVVATTVAPAATLAAPATRRRDRIRPTPAAAKIRRAAALQRLPSET